MEGQTIQEVIDDETVAQIRKLSDLEYGSEEYKKAVEGISTLRKLSLEDSKLDLAWDEKAKELEVREKEIEQKAKEAKLVHEDAEKDRWVKIGLGVFSVVVPAAIYSSWTRKGFKFEQTGIIKTSTMRSVLSNSTKWIGKFF